VRAFLKAFAWLRDEAEKEERDEREAQKENPRHWRV
jgi:hypothetical protein